MNRTKRVKRRSMVKPNGEPYRTCHVQVPTDPSEWISIDVPAIVDASTFDRAQELLTLNKRFAKPAFREWLLRSLIVCPDCGTRWTGSPSSNGHKEYRYYRCPNAKPGDYLRDCHVDYRLRADEAEQAVWDYIIGYLSDEDQLLVDIEERQKHEAAERAGYDRRLRALDSELIHDQPPSLRTDGSGTRRFPG